MVKYRLKDLFNLFAGGDIDTEHFSQYKTPTHCFPIYSNSLNNKGLYGYTSVPKYKGNAITITGRGSVGHAEYRKQDFDAIIRLLILIPKKADVVNSYYLTQFINQYVSFPLESTGVPQLTVPQIENIEVELPDFAEQATVAEALSDIDSLISSLQKLIEKKKAIKQGAMQELLTGKKRLPGFSGEWEKNTLKQICEFINGRAYSQHELLSRGKYKVLRLGNLFTNSHWYYTDLELGEKQYCETGDLLYAWSASFGPTIWDGEKSVFHYHIWKIKCSETIDKKYLYHFLNADVSSILNELQGGTMSHLTKENMENRLCSYPKLDEQQAIAQVLSDMDSEIEQLEKKFAKYQQIKQGMMQELLTGRIRLVDADGKDQSQTQAVQKKQPQKKQPQQAHNQHFDDAVMIAGIVNAFYSEKYPLGRKKVQKLLYLVRRKEQADISAFHKKAAGPYADEVRYKGGEPIAQKNKYIQVKRNEKGSRFEKGVQMQRALAYLQDWGKQTDIDWLVSQFQYTNVNDLELFATVDMAICDLKQEGKEISVASIKNLISSNKEWRAKLKKTYFRDSEIQRAIKKCQDLFES